MRHYRALGEEGRTFARGRYTFAMDARGAIRFRDLGEDAAKFVAGAKADTNVERWDFFPGQAAIIIDPVLDQPGDDRGPVVPARPIVVNVRVSREGQVIYTVENEPFALDALAERLEQARVRNRDQAVIIRGDRQVRWDAVAAVMQACAKAGINRVSATYEVIESRP